ncbi:MAG: hypothetical protein ACLFR1_02785 [Spirochaetia bacterium]
MKRICIIFILVTWSVSLLYGADIRNITNFRWDRYNYTSGAIDNGFTLEDVFAFSFHPSVTYLIKATGTYRNGLQLLGGGGGIVFPHLPGFYSELSYMQLNHIEDGLMHRWYGDINWEVPGFYAIVSLRADVTTELVSFIGLGGRWYVTNGLSLWSRYTAVVSTETGLTHAYWGEAEFVLLDSLNFRIGGTASYEPISASLGQYTSEFGVLAGLGAVITQNIRVKNTTSLSWRESQTILSVSLVLDITGSI